MHSGNQYTQNDNWDSSSMLFRGEVSTTSNCQVTSIYTQNLMMLIDVSNWPIFRCGKKMKRHSMFKLTQHINN
jgi:hypothetical protein